MFALLTFNVIYTIYLKSIAIYRIEIASSKLFCDTKKAGNKVPAYFYAYWLQFIF